MVAARLSRPRLRRVDGPAQVRHRGVADSDDVDVRAATVAAATRLFAAHGFEGTALQDIADAVGVTKPAVLHHFPSKEHVRQAVLDAILTHWNEALPRLLLAATASHDRFDAVFGETLRFFAADPDRARLIVRETLSRPAEMRRLLKGPVRRWLAAVADYVRAGKANGRHYADVDPEAYVVHVLLLVITATAAASVTSAVLEDGVASAGRRGKDEVDGRFRRELARIARASLFPSERTSDDRRIADRKRKPDGTTPPGARPRVAR
ncbi:MAG TPA: helix-turn-helix domain-containing protein [Polyangiaceae bacterium]|nr:helix-turn-helix domain-containing protein [Polyangiaceae bacterium]